MRKSFIWTVATTWVVIGACGGIGRAHCKVIRAMKNARLVAIVDLNETAGLELAKEHRCKYYRTVEEFLAKEKVDCASIATPPPLHAASAVPLLEAGIHCLVEKPFAHTMYDAKLMLQAAKRSGKQLGVICQRRFLAPCLRLAQAIADGLIGTPKEIIVNMYGWRSPEYYKAKDWLGDWATEGGALLVNQAPHQLDLALWFGRSKIKRVMGKWTNIAHNDCIEAEDTVKFWVELENGCEVTGFLTNAMKPGIVCNVHVLGDNWNTIGVQTDKGAMFVAGATGLQGVSKPAIPPVTDIWDIEGNKELLDAIQHSETEAHLSLEDPVLHYHGLLFDEFNQCVMNDEPFAIDGLAGEEVVKLFTAIYLSHALGNVWVDFPLKENEFGVVEDFRPIPYPEPVRLAMEAAAAMTSKSHYEGTVLETEARSQSYCDVDPLSWVGTVELPTGEIDIQGDGLVQQTP